VWLYHRFPLSFREVEELMLQRGVVVSYETIRQWCAKFGQVYANRLRRRRARLSGLARNFGDVFELWSGGQCGVGVVVSGDALE
jgi:putative transposase